MDDMETVREYVNEGLSLRAKSGLKVRQPLASVSVPTTGEHVDFEPILKDELNVKAVKSGEVVSIDETLTPELKREGLMREVIRHIQAARKAAGLSVDDRIILALLPGEKAPELEVAMKEHAKAIADETLTTVYAYIEEGDGYESKVVVEGEELAIRLKKG